MKFCCVDGCGLSSNEATVFEFPTSRLWRKRWLDAMNSDAKISTDGVVCLHHFTADDYEDVRGKTRLKAKVVPSVFRGAISQSPPRLDDVSKNNQATDEESQSTNYTDDHNGVDKDNGSVTGDNEQVTNEKATNEKVTNEKVTNENKHKGDELSLEGNLNGDLDTDSNLDNDTVTEKNTDNTNAKENGHNTDPNSNNEIVTNVTNTDNDKAINVTNVNNENVNSDATNNNETATDTRVDNATATVATDNYTEKAVTKPKRVRKKWVPMRKMPRRDRDLSEDSSDSVNSDLPAPPVLEDLEEQLPNYQIANMKTERQVAAMSLADEPLQPDFMDQDVEEMVIEPHVPVFIELSVGQEPTDTEPNDCVMVVESVECDIDPTIMLQARAEEEECCEQIDLDDEDDEDDDDDDDVTETTDSIAPSPAKSRSSKPKSDDPISLLTSSDEDDVIIQEPHIDTLSVSDATTEEEDNLPLKKLIKREKKAKKSKKSSKKSKKDNNKSQISPEFDAFVGVTDFYCYICRHISQTRQQHIVHMKDHETDSEAAKIYQICKDCGFTTASKAQLSRHQRKHTTEKKFRCSLCSYRSKYNMSLLYHLKTHEFDPDMYDCGSCGVKLQSKRELLGHQKVCSVLFEKFSCKSCSFVGRSRRELKEHRSALHKKVK